MASDTSALTYSVLYPNSSATMSIVSASILWFMLTIMPMLMQVAMIWFTGTFIIAASSLAVTNSVSLSILLCEAISEAASSALSLAFSRFSRRYFAPLESFPLLVRRANVSLTCFATSSSETSGFSGWSLRIFPFWRLASLLALRCWLRESCWRAPPLLFTCCPTAFTSTRSFPIRLRFLRCPPCVAAAFCLFFSSRSLRFSSFVFFFGRMDWFIEERSIVPNTFGVESSTCG